MDPTITLKWTLPNVPPFWPLLRDGETGEPLYTWSCGGKSVTADYPVWFVGLMLGVNALYADGAERVRLARAGKKVERILNQ